MADPGDFSRRTLESEMRWVNRRAKLLTAFLAATGFRLDPGGSALLTEQPLLEEERTNNLILACREPEFTNPEHVFTIRTDGSGVDRAPGAADCSALTIAVRKQGYHYTIEEFCKGRLETRTGIATGTESIIRVAVKYIAEYLPSHAGQAICAQMKVRSLPTDPRP